MSSRWRKSRWSSSDISRLSQPVKKSSVRRSSWWSASLRRLCSQRQGKNDLWSCHYLKSTCSTSIWTVLRRRSLMLSRRWRNGSLHCSTRISHQRLNARTSLRSSANIQGLVEKTCHSLSSLCKFTTLVMQPQVEPFHHRHWIFLQWCSNLDQPSSRSNLPIQLMTSVNSLHKCTQSLCTNHPSSNRWWCRTHKIRLLHPYTILITIHHLIYQLRTHLK